MLLTVAVLFVAADMTSLTLSSFAGTARRLAAIPSLPANVTLTCIPAIIRVTVRFLPFPYAPGTTPPCPP